MDVKQLGLHVREKRKAMGMTLRQLARILKIDPSVLSRFEVGLRTPHIETLKVICAHFNFEIEAVDLYKNVNFEPVKIVYLKKPKEERIIQCDRCLARKKLYL